MVRFLEHSGLSTICSHLEDPGSKVSKGKWQEMVDYIFDILSAFDFSSKFWHKFTQNVDKILHHHKKIEGSSFFPLRMYWIIKLYSRLKLQCNQVYIIYMYWF